MTIIQFPARGRFLKAKKSDSPPQKTGRNTRTYLEVRDREYLFEAEVKAMIQVAFKGRWGHRDSTLILMGCRHGLRISELVNLRWQQINFNPGHFHVRRVKGSRPSVHPLSGEEMRESGRLRRDYPDSPYIFVSQRGGPMTPDAARKMIRKAGEGGEHPFHVTPPSL